MIDQKHLIPCPVIAYCYVCNNQRMTLWILMGLDLEYNTPDSNWDIFSVTIIIVRSGINNLILELAVCISLWVINFGKDLT